MILLALLLAETAVPASPPPPPPDATQPLHQAVVDAIRNCPQSHGDEIAVCARDRGFSERYRFERLKPRVVDPPKVKVDVTAGAGAAGQGSCSTVGAAGTTGCILKADRDWGAWKAEEKANGRWFPW